MGGEKRNRKSRDYLLTTKYCRYKQPQNANETLQCLNWVYGLASLVPGDNNWICICSSYTVGDRPNKSFANLNRDLAKVFTESLRWMILRQNSENSQAFCNFLVMWDVSILVWPSNQRHKSEILKSSRDWGIALKRTRNWDATMPSLKGEHRVIFRNM